MEKEQFDEIRNFTRSLNAKRLLMPDGQLLDLCQQHLDALVAHLTDNFEEHPHEETEATAPAPPPEEEPEPPAPPPSEPEPEVRHHTVVHKMPHKRPTPRKTHR